MVNTKGNPQALRQVKAFRIATDTPEQQHVEEACDVATEAPLTIDVEDFGTYTVLCTPDDKRAMAVGFMFSEGIIDRLEDIGLLNECMDDPQVIRVKLGPNAPDQEGKQRNLLIVSSCGVCGSESMDEKLNAMNVVGDTLKVKRQVLRAASNGLSSKQTLFKKSGGTHAIGIFDEHGEIVAFAEDIGRHNALDKAIGKCILMGKPTNGLAAALSGRVSLEMVGKCARAGIELISAVSAPTSLGLDSAEHCNITLCAFVRDTRATVFCGKQRIVD